MYGIQNNNKIMSNYIYIYIYILRNMSKHI